MKVRVEKLTIKQAPVVFEWVLNLLKELGEEGDELGKLKTRKVLRDWDDHQGHFHVFAAKDGRGRMIGILTLAESFAIYANGSYGIINEMLTSADHRSAGVGAKLVEAAKQFGKKRGWARIDVTAPESRRWKRSRRFYEKQGFTFTGPKLRILLK
ncbi:MAG TPA: GNAT family N-acetyltransferase [Acidobacteriota bacterium]|nr:GNAT family N-acetyltransferase [Acidobacteriota bacterium]